MRKTAVLSLFFLVAASVSLAADWPMYQHDEARSGATDESLMPPLWLKWTFVPAQPPKTAWPDPGKEMARVAFDDAFQVAVADGKLYFGSSSEDKVCALDAQTGEVAWTYLVAGPVRLAPSVFNGRVYFGSDDGFAYCLNGQDGTLIWKTHAAYDGDKLLGNGRMISRWPVRTGVLVDDGIAYFGAGVFPHEGTFICAADAETGAIIWRNDLMGDRSLQLNYGGLSPQGHLLATDEVLYVPSARAMPAAFSRKDGSFLYFCDPGDRVGGTWALLTGDELVAGMEAKKVFNESTGQQDPTSMYGWYDAIRLVADNDASYVVSFDGIGQLLHRAAKHAGEWHAQLAAEAQQILTQIGDIYGKKLSAPPEEQAKYDYEIAELYAKHGANADQQARLEEALWGWRKPTDCLQSIIMSGKTLFLGGENRVTAIEKEFGQEFWGAPVEGKANGLAVANGCLYVSTDTGRIYCFTVEKTEQPATITPPPPQNPYPLTAESTFLREAADYVLEDTGITKGWALVIGAPTGQMAYELATRTDLNVVVVESDPDNVANARAKMDAAGLHGHRVTVHEAEYDALPFADYFANLVVMENTLMWGVGSPLGKGGPDEVRRMLNPNGGVLHYRRPGDPYEPTHGGLANWLDAGSGLVTGTGSTVARNPLDGTGSWTHLYADAANTACSDDTRVRGALETLWFGQPGPAQMVDRHARDAAPVSIDGRMFVEGENTLMAYDAYNGVHLWQRDLPGAVRVRVDSDMSNLALAHDGLYVAAYEKCHRLDPITGKTMRVYTMPVENHVPARWGYIAYEDGILFGSRAPKLKMDYGQAWEESHDAEGNWTEKADILGAGYQKTANNFEKADQAAFWNVQQLGLMWHSMANFPAWGSVDSPATAITEKVMASDRFFALDSESGDTLWTYDGLIAHPTVAIGDGIVFLADLNVTDEEKQQAMAERQRLFDEGVWQKDKADDVTPEQADVRRMVAIDARTGKIKWERVVDLTGCGGDRMGLAYKDGLVFAWGCFSNHDQHYFYTNQLTWRRITALNAEDGSNVWSKPLNYLRRPLIVGDKIIIEPRACNMYTGDLVMREYPLTGKQEEWEFIRPGHCCSITTASANMMFLRGFYMWYYDFERDQGMLPFGGIRPGCWINIIPANGVLLFPEASSGCTCSYPIRSTVVMKPVDTFRQWSVFIQHAAMTPVKHVGINFGAPGDWREENKGTLWLAYPRPKENEFLRHGTNVEFAAKQTENSTLVEQGLRGAMKTYDDYPWVYASGINGVEEITIPLRESTDESEANYTVRLFLIGENDRPFSVHLGDTIVDKRVKLAEGMTSVREYAHIPIAQVLRLGFSAGDMSLLPRLCGIEIERETPEPVAANTSEGMEKKHP